MGTMTSIEQSQAGYAPRRPASGPSGARERGKAGRSYFFTCLAFVLTLVVGGGMSNSVPADRIIYTTLLCIICAGPFFLARGNSRNRILSLFMGCYFLIFGAATSIGILTGKFKNALVTGVSSGAFAQGSLTKSDLVVLLGALCFLAGYYFLTKISGRGRYRFLSREWRYHFVLITGLFLWLLGVIYNVAYEWGTSIYYQRPEVLYLPRGIASNLRQFEVLGALMLIYLTTRDYRKRLVWTLLLLVIGIEFVEGFFLNSKETSFRVPVLLLLGSFYLTGKVNLKLVTVMILVSIPYILYFNAYRMNLLEQSARYRDTGGAASDFFGSLKTIERKAKGEKNVASYSLEVLRQRIDGKVYVDIIVNGVDSGRVASLDGYSLWLFFTSWVPRQLWPDKPDTATGQLFNRAFHLSESRFTYVPTTQLGELYWNFGMLGVITGMFIIGMIFARLGGVLSQSGQMTLLRFLVLMLATYMLAVRFEENIASQYAYFLRLVMLIWLMDKMASMFGINRKSIAV